MTLVEAYQKLEAATPQSDSISIQMETWKRSNLFTQTRKDPMEVTFSVWDGETNFEGPTLENVVDQCLAAHGVRLTSVEEVEPVVSEAHAAQQTPARAA